MQKIIFYWTFSLTLLWGSMAHAQVVVVYDPATTDIYSISDKNDAVIPAGFKVSSLPGKAEDYQKDVKDYQIASGRLKLNVEKIKQREQARKALNDREKDIEAVRKKSQKMAYEQLKTEGYKFNVLTDKDFE